MSDLSPAVEAFGAHDAVMSLIPLTKILVVIYFAVLVLLTLTVSGVL